MHKILVVDDEEKIVNVLTEFLTKMGFEVVKAVGGEKGIEVMRSDTKIDLMVVDMKMPKVAGIDVIKEHKALHKKFPMIILTGSIDVEKYLIDLKNFGLTEDSIFHKPVDLFALLDRVKNKLEIP